MVITAIFSGFGCCRSTHTLSYVKLLHAYIYTHFKNDCLFSSCTTDPLFSKRLFVVFSRILNQGGCWTWDLCLRDLFNSNWLNNLPIFISYYLSLSIRARCSSWRTCNNSLASLMLITHSTCGGDLTKEKLKWKKGLADWSEAGESLDTLPHSRDFHNLSYFLHCKWTQTSNYEITLMELCVR